MTSVVFTWLERIGLSYTIDNFKAKGVNSPQSLLRLTPEDYEELGLKDKGESLAMLHCIDIEPYRKFLHVPASVRLLDHTF